MRAKRCGLLGNRPYPARRAVTMAVLDEVNADPIDTVLYEAERRDVDDGWLVRHETEVPQ